jgi:transposase
MKRVYPDWVLAQKRKGTAIHYINGSYYLYEVSSRWDKDKKRSVRLTGKSLGRITEQGLVPRSERPSRTDLKRIDYLEGVSVKEYGVSHLILNSLKSYLTKLATTFPAEWEYLVCLAYCRMVHQSPIKMMPLHIGHSFLSEQLGSVPKTDKQISLFLRDIGRNRDRISDFMKSSISSGEHLLLDMTNLPSKSTKIVLSQQGYNSDWNFETQFNLLYIYSTNLQMPVFYRLIPGNIRDVSSLKLTVKESGKMNCVLIADKGFCSRSNIQHIEDSGLSYIIPLRRDNDLIDYAKFNESIIKTGKDYFRFEKRYIWHTSYLTADDTNRRVFLFLDDTLKNKEQSDYLSRIDGEVEHYTMEKFHEKKQMFGTIAIISDLTDKAPEEIYIAYKTRMAIEGTFDVAKTVLDADKTYMQNEEVLQGWMFVNHIAMQWYYHIYHSLIQHKQLKKYSVQDVITHLLGIRMVKINDHWQKAEVVKATEAMLAKIALPIV